MGNESKQQVAQGASQPVIDQTEAIPLTPADQQCFADAIVSPPPIAPAMERALARRSQLLPEKLRPFLPIAEYQALGALRWHERNCGHSDGFKLRYLDQFRADYGYVLPSCELMQKLAGFLGNNRQVIDAGCGSGYISQELSRLGLEDTAAVDIRDYREHRATGYPIKQVHKLDIQTDAVTVVGAEYVRSVLLVWPPHDFPFALKIAKAMRSGQVLVYEGEDKGGCTANDEFFHFVADRRIWEPLEDIADLLNDVHIVMPGSIDGWKVWRKF
jgi:hypothetical protein